MELGRSTLARFEGLAENGFASALQIDERRKEVLQLEGSRLQLKRQEVQLDNAIRQYVQDLAELKAALLGVEATTSRELETLGQERVLHHASASTVITAPIGGTVAGLQIAPGATVQLGAGLLSVVPSGSVMRAELLVPTRAIGFVRKGNRVKLRFDAFPHQKFGHQSGYVSQVALAPVTEDERPGSEPVYKVTVALDRQSVLAYGNEEALRAGMVVEVDILSETRRLIEWVLEPLYSVHGRISAA